MTASMEPRVLYVSEAADVGLILERGHRRRAAGPHRPADLGNGAFGFIPVIGLSLTYDHRAIDGEQATLFLREIKNQIENFNEKI